MGGIGGTVTTEKTVEKEHFYMFFDFDKKEEAYGNEQARKQAKGGSCAVRDDVVYEWAEDYYHKHKERDTYEVPGGHREAGEDILETAKRELQEETGAIKFEIKPICVYSVTGKTRVNDTGEETFGMLYFADITMFEEELHSEMEKVVLLDELPTEWAYPLIQPLLIEEYERRL